MNDQGGSATERAIAELKKPGVAFKLLKFARWRTESDADAKDLLQSALAKVFDPKDSPWDPDGTASFFMHVGSIVNGLAANARRSWHARHEVPDPSLANDGAVDGAPTADHLLDEQRGMAWRRRMGALLIAALEKDDPEAAKVLRVAVEQGFDSHEELAGKAGCTPGQLHDALRRIKYHAARLLEQERKAELQRMADLRQK